LGPFRATLGGEPAKGLNSEHLRALLAYVAVESGREHPREQLASFLWPERPDREALSALRSALSNLHAALGDRRSPSPFILVARTSVQFNPAGDYWLDVADFDGLRISADVSGLERAASLYRGPFLDGLSLGDSPAFGDWLLLKEEQYRRRVLGVLGQLGSLHLAAGSAVEAARWARRQLELEPYREQAHRQLMAALALGGERSAALAHYDSCRRLLASELGCAPEDETQALYAQIRDGTLSLPQPSVLILPGPSSAAASRPTTASPTGSLAAQGPDAPAFVARERELARLSALLDRALAGCGGVVLISGEPGAGKTALLDEWARQSTRVRGDLIALRGNCNAYGGAEDSYLPFREILQTLAGDVEAKRAGGALSAEQARRVWDALPVVGAALVEHGPDLIDRFVPGEALLRRAEAFGAPSGQGWLVRLREMASSHTHAGAGAAPAFQGDLFAQVTQVLHTVSQRRPLLLAIDDLQWAGGGTAALLFHLGRRLAGSRILLACAYRPELAVAGGGDPLDAPQHQLQFGPGVGTVIGELRREWGDVLVDLDEADGQAFVEAYVDSEPNCLRQEFRQALYDHTGGNPLFTVELLRAFGRDGTLVRDEDGRWTEAAAPIWERWPPQVEAVLAGHLAGLGNEDRTLLQAASVQGEQFIAEVAARVLGWSDEAAMRRLSGPLRTRHRLVEAVSLERLSWSAQHALTGSGQRLSRYRFRHSLLQSSAYRSLDPVEQGWLHEATARALQAIYDPAGHAGSRLAVQALAPELARHYEAAGLPLEAAWQRLEAGRWAAALVAYDDAIAHLEHGLEVLDGVPASGEGLHLRLALCLALVNPVMLRQGWRGPGYERVRGLLSRLAQCPELQGDPQCLAALAMLAMLAAWSADPEGGRRVGEQLLAMASEGDPHVLMLAHWTLGHVCSLRGQFASGREHLEQALVLHDPGAGRALSSLLGADPVVAGYAQLAWDVWELGYPDQARAKFEKALAGAEAMDQPSSMAFAHLMAGMACSILGRDFAASHRHSLALRPLAGAGLEYGHWADLLAAEAQLQTQDGQAGARGSMAALEQAVARAAQAASALEALGSGAGYASQSLIHARLCSRAGQAAAGLEALDRARAWIERTDMRSQEAEVWRMRGELLLQAGGGSGRTEVEAEACFRRALDVARGRQARWPELRAAVSLTRLWQAHGRREEGRELLAGIYAWFTEGFDAVDLAEARALLDRLA
jgi:DNA-binding SARP family transcriptional activator/tetratricopeptide (TPR) repeat protein